MGVEKAAAEEPTSPGGQRVPSCKSNVGVVSAIHLFVHCISSMHGPFVYCTCTCMCVYVCVL